MAECVICTEKLGEGEYTFLPNCNHNIFHRDCLEKCFKAECPLCRAPHNIKVFGEPPKPDNSIPREPVQYLEVRELERFFIDDFLDVPLLEHIVFVVNTETNSEFRYRIRRSFCSNPNEEESLDSEDEEEGSLDSEDEEEGSLDSDENIILGNNDIFEDW